MRRWQWPGLAALVLLGAAQVPAQERVMMHNGGVPFISGGIGADAQERLDARAKEFNLKLVFTLTEGNYIADVNVTIKDAAGRTLVEDVAEGPFFMARLPAGTYTVSAAYDGKTLTRRVAVQAGRLRTEYLRWPADPKTDFPLPRDTANGK